MEISFDDLEDVRRRIVDGVTGEAYEEEWRLPVNQIDEESQYMYNIRSNNVVKNMNFKESEFERTSKAATCVLKLVRKSMQYHARKSFSGLQIGQFIYQGSSSDGLKVGDPDEYDALLEFSIKGLRFSHYVLEDSKGNQLSEFAYIHVEHYLKDLQNQYPELYLHGIFEYDNGTVSLNSRKLYERVFVSLVDKARNELTQKINQWYGPRDYPFKIDRIYNQPSINIRVFINEDDHQTLKEILRPESANYPQDWSGDVIDIDIVPGIQFGIEQVLYRNRWMDCPRHCVFKWKHDNQTSELPTKNSSHLWRVCTSTYELYVLNVSRGYRKHRCVLTALRILKAYLRYVKGHRLFRISNSAIATILRSYHLKSVSKKGNCRTSFIITLTCDIFYPTTSPVRQL